MVKIRTINTPEPPEGWELIENTLIELSEKMKEHERESSDGKRKAEILWPIFRIHHQRSRYVYEMYHIRKEISRELYNYCIDEGYADQALIAKWKKKGYEKLCCLRCIQTGGQNFGTTCICRVPKKDLGPDKVSN